MKKLLFPTLLLPLILIPTLISCGQSDMPKLTFGSLIAQEKHGNYTGGYYVTYAEIKERIKSGETMLIAIYPGEDSTCGCWLTFSRVIERYVNNTNNKVYCVNYFDVIASHDEYGFEGYSDSPTFHIVSKSNIIFKSSYKYDSKDIYTSENLLAQTVNKFVSAPTMYEIDKTALDDVRDDQKASIFYSRGTCADCNYVIPNFLTPYFENTTKSHKLYVFDLDTVKAEGNEVYQTFKDVYGLSNKNNTEYGYDTGYVPTFQYLENGVIKSQITYFNDTISKENDKYFVTHSYYTQERLSSLSFLNNSDVEHKVLQGLEINNDDVYDMGDFIIWKQEKAAKYHDPLLKTYLDFYLK